MLHDEEKSDPTPSPNWKTFSRSVSWAEGPPRKPNPKPHSKSKARAFLPPLSIIRPTIEEWPQAGSDDLGIWPNNPLTPGARSGPITPHEKSKSKSTPVEFDFRKDKLAFFDKECSKILDHIYLGSDAIAKNREILRQNGITHVLNCVGFVCQEYFKNELVYKTLWLQDCPSEDITSILYDVFDYFEDVREQGKRVLVHCCQGVSRSTSLVIAYLMWKNGQSFDEAYQYVKEARGITNPNIGFACQLLQCQKRVHALPLSPNSLLRIYRMAPHSPYDPLHLVPKIIREGGDCKLDSRGAFIVHVPTNIYVWTGKLCCTMMLDHAVAAAEQVVRYEKARGPVVIVREGEETSEFFKAINTSYTTRPILGKLLPEYDLDFEIFGRAVSGGVVPPFPLSEVGPVTCLPVRENGWNRLRRKFANGIMKGFVASKKLYPIDSNEEVCDLVDSFSSLMVGSKPNPYSDSNLLSSTATSDYKRSFTFSPSSSNWPDLSPNIESRESYISRRGTFQENHRIIDESASVPDYTNTPQPEEPF